MTLDQMAARLAACPANAWLGLLPQNIDQSGLTVSIPVRPEMMGRSVAGAMHGGMAAAIIDTLCSYAWLTLHEGRVATVDMRVDYHRPVVGDRLLGKAQLVRAGQKIATADAQILSPDGTLLTSGRTVMIPYPA